MLSPHPPGAEGRAIVVELIGMELVNRRIVTGPTGASTNQRLASRSGGGASLAPSRCVQCEGMAKKNQSPPKTFEEGLAELEEILSQIESGQVGLEESLAKHERGTFLIQHCRGVLNRAEKQIELLTKSPDGGLEVSPLEDNATANSED